MKIAAVSLFIATVPGVVLQAQKPPEKPVYTYIAEYGVPRANWDEFTARWEKQSVPVLEKMVADGTVLEFGASASVVHTPEGSTHTLWWSSTTVAGTQRVMEQMAKAGATSPAITGMTHRDRLLRSVVYKSRSARQTSGFSEVNIFYVKPGQTEKWRELYDKYTLPVLEKLFEQGTILGYGVDAEYVHTEKMGARYSWTMYPNAEAIDKVNAAFDEARRGASEDERRKVMAEYREVYEPDSHRDGLDRVIRWVRK